jgi:hypothetical protein
MCIPWAKISIHFCNSVSAFFIITMIDATLFSGKPAVSTAFVFMPEGGTFCLLETVAGLPEGKNNRGIAPQNRKKGALCIGKTLSLGRE